MTAQPGYRLLLALLRRSAFVLVFAASAGTVHAQVAKDTPFGTELVTPHFPNSSAQDMFAALTLSATLGGHSSFVWHWGDVNSPRSVVLTLPPLMRKFGLKSVIQLGATFLGNPAPPPGYVRSFADPQVRNRYIDDVIAVAGTHPDYIVLMTEANLVYRFNRPEFENFRSLYTQAYKAVKLVSPNTKVGVSFLYLLWFNDYWVNSVDVPGLLTPSDFVAFTTYPDWLVRLGYYPSIAAIPPAYHGYARAAYPNASIVFSEVGWASKGRSTPELQAEFVRNLPRLLSTARPELVTWALLYDVEFFQRSLLSAADIKFLVGLSVDIDLLFEHFNGMGLSSGYGTPKPALQDAMHLVFNKP